VPDLAPKYKGRKIKPHNTSNRLETGPKTVKRLQLTQEKTQRRAAREAAEEQAQNKIAGEFDEEDKAGLELSEDLIKTILDSLKCLSTPP
jgi:hypothetical protein